MSAVPLQATENHPGRRRPGAPSSGQITNLVVTCLMFAAALAVFVPFRPVLPEMGLDPSWRLALNEATARHGALAFGSQIVFTYGPYASVFTGEYHPALAVLTYAASAWIALAYATAMRITAPRHALLVPLLLCLYISIPGIGKDALYLSAPILVTLATFVLLRRDGADDGPRTWLAYAVVCSLSGLLPLVKGTFVVACVASTVINALQALIGRRAGLAVIGVLAPALTMLACWTMAGQPLVALPSYLMSTIQTVSSYGEAMAISGDPREIVGFGGAASLLVAAIVSARRTPLGLRIFLAASFAIFLFIAFKSAFVRHDMGHVHIAGRVVLVAALCVLLAIRAWPLFVAAFFAAGFWLVIEQRQDPPFIDTLATRISQPYRDAWFGVSKRIVDSGWPENAFDDALARIRFAYPLPRLEGSTDIYSSNQANLIAAGNEWSPRPVFQSYAAYDARLMALNARHLEGLDAPANVIFQVDPLDGRLPALEDGASWRSLIANYHATSIQGELLFLKRNVSRVTSDDTTTTSVRVSMGVPVALPPTSDLLYAHFQIEPTIFGQLSALLFKVEAPTIVLRLDDGRKRRYRLLPRMAQSAFVLSPLVETTDDFARLFGAYDDMPPKRVVSFTVEQGPRRWPQWRSHFEVTLTTRALAAEAPAGGLPRHRAAGLSEGDSGQQAALAGRCEGDLESVDAPRDATGRYLVADQVDIHGWAFAPGATRRIAAVLSDREGRRLFATLRGTLRADLALHRRRPELASAGYLGTVATAVPSGDYKLGVAIGVDGAWTLCTNFDREIRVSAHDTVAR